MIHAGIDEAGYGPLLGPLVIGAAAFRLPDGPGPSLRERVKGIWCRASERGPRVSEAVPVDDSKEVHRRHGVPGLARGVASAAAGMGRAPATDLHDWLARFSDRPAEAFANDPWFEAPRSESIPRYAVPAGLRERMLLRGAEPVSLVVSPIVPAELNEAFEATGNKARVLFLSTAALLVRVLEAFPGEDVSVTLDREGGRLDYAEYLADAFPWHDIREEASAPGEARYAFREGGREVRLRFATRGDGEDIAVGLASMAAKMTRELFMGRLNAWFLARQPGLKRTAGYVEDGRRFLVDAAPVLERERVDMGRLVRSR